MSKFTAISRKTLSLPMKYLLDIGEVFGECLDYGCGRGFDCDTLGMDGYDPNWRPILPNKLYDRIFCNYVLNVVDEETEKYILYKIRNLLKDDGIGFISVRRDIIKNTNGRGCIQRVVTLSLESFVLVKNKFEIYKVEKI